MSVVTDRIRVLADALGAPTSGKPSSLVELIVSQAGEPVSQAGEPRHEISYLVLAVLGAQIPEPSLVKDFTRDWRATGLAPLVRHLVRQERLRPGVRLPVRVVDGTIADVTDTLASGFTTGIQRVARETVSRWWSNPARKLTLVRWDVAGRRLVSLDAAEIARVVSSSAEADSAHDPAVVVPFRASFVLPEISVAHARTARLRTIGRYGGGRATAIGFDCIPITTAETAGAGMPGAFSKYLSALARFDAIAPISDAAATEYRGWRRMLSGAGLSGPAIHTLELPFTSTGASDAGRADELRDQLGLREVPIVLCVGSHEPRKNHLGVLHAAELAWRAGRDFALVLVGGNSWDTEAFDRLIAELRRRERRVLTLSGVADEVIWDLYDLAEFSVFPSLNEGFGLPVVESLSHGTPVVTSRFGSMRALGEGHGALLVDPKDPAAIAAAMMRLLDDPDERARLCAESVTAPSSTWDAYADDLWALTRRPQDAASRIA